MSNLTYRSSSEELADPGSVSREHVLERLRDWRDRVHNLYGEIERVLKGSVFRVLRESKAPPVEELPQRVGITTADQPAIDTLRIVRPDGMSAAILAPKGLWIIGANGRIDLRILPTVGSTENYMLVDQSNPMAGPSHWIRMPIGSPFERESFDPHWLLSRLH